MWCMALANVLHCTAKIEICVRCWLRSCVDPSVFIPLPSRKALSRVTLSVIAFSWNDFLYYFPFTGKSVSLYCTQIIDLSYPSQAAGAPHCPKGRFIQFAHFQEFSQVYFNVSTPFLKIADAGHCNLFKRAEQLSMRERNFKITFRYFGCASRTETHRLISYACSVLYTCIRRGKQLPLHYILCLFFGRWWQHPSGWQADAGLAEPYICRPAQQTRSSPSWQKNLSGDPVVYILCTLHFAVHCGEFRIVFRVSNLIQKNGRVPM